VRYLKQSVSVKGFALTGRLQRQVPTFPSCRTLVGSRPNIPSPPSPSSSQGQAPRSVLRASGSVVPLIKHAICSSLCFRVSVDLGFCLNFVFRLLRSCHLSLSLPHTLSSLTSSTSSLADLAIVSAPNTYCLLLLLRSISTNPPSLTPYAACAVEALF
jgi:hypothetical protein